MWRSWWAFRLDNGVGLLWTVCLFAGGQPLAGDMPRESAAAAVSMFLWGGYIGVSFIRSSQWSRHAYVKLWSCPGRCDMNSAPCIGTGMRCRTFPVTVVHWLSPRLPESVPTGASLHACVGTSSQAVRSAWFILMTAVLFCFHVDLEAIADRYGT